MQMSGVLSMRLTTVEKSHITFDNLADKVWVDNIPWRRFLQQFSSVKALRTKGRENLAHILLRDREKPDDGLPFLPSLEEIVTHETRSQLGSELATFLFVRQQAGRPVKLVFGT
jgi:hypothetical protein